MTIFQKTISFFTVSLLLLLATLGLFARYYLINEFKELEIYNTLENLNRIKTVYEDEKHNLLQEAKELATPLTAATPIGGHQAAASLLTKPFFENRDITLVLKVNANKEVKHSQYYDFAEASLIATPGELQTSLLAAVFQRFPLFSNEAGLIKIHNLYYLVAVHPLLKQQGMEPPYAYIIVTRHYSPFVIDKMRNLTKLNIDTQNYNKRIFTLPAQQQYLDHNGHFIHTHNNETIEGYQIINDFNGEPLVVLTFQEQRDLYAQGKKSIYYFFIYITSSALFFLVILLVIFNGFFLRKLHFINNTLKGIELEGDNITRIPEKGNDELTLLVRSINMMIASIEDSFKRKALYEARQEVENKILIELAKDKDVNEGNIFITAKKICVAIDSAINTERCSLWLLNNDHSYLSCYFLIDSINNNSYGGYVVRYQQIAHLMKSIQSDKVHTDYGTEAMSEVQIVMLEYDNSRVATSTVYVPIVTSAGMSGFLCVEYFSKPYQWRADEEVFLVSICEFAAHALERHEKQNREKQLFLKANYDPLTGLANRTLFNMRLLEACEVATKQYFVALFYIDLDNFKPINDTHGHEYGDYVLKHCSKIMKNVVRSTDTVARIGGDEFCIIFTHTSSQHGILKLAQKLIDELNIPFHYKDVKLFIGCSIGISFFPGEAYDYQDLLTKADEAMYEAKNKGRNTYTVFGNPRIEAPTEANETAATADEPQQEASNMSQKAENKGAPRHS